ncbi:ABC transporter ATP-binding protein [Pontibacter pamirensis]|uniref:ABC transporter ATP-binding protein n=1 Tax=Pontibacter pamirensis TaxID=2562824 RepID=UPI00138A4866|nr:ABC transporter ATP-binding protein [Pontibacter pamirensis]
MIKKIRIYRILAAAALLLAPFIANAQSDKEVLNIDKAYDRVLKVYPLQLGEAYLAYEKMRTHRISNEFGLSYIYSTYMKGDGSTPESQPVQGASVRMSQRKYTLKNEGRPFGFFHGPLFGYRFLAYEQDVFEQLAQSPDAPTYHGVGRLYQHSLDLSYQLGIQFNLMGLLTADVAAAFGGRVKYALANNAGDLLTDHIIGHAVIAENNSAIFAVPLPQLNLSVGYAF